MDAVPICTAGDGLKMLAAEPVLLGAIGYAAQRHSRTRLRLSCGFACLYKPITTERLGFLSLSADSR